MYYATEVKDKIDQKSFHFFQSFVQLPYEEKKTGNHCVFACEYILLIYPLAPHEDLGFTVQRESTVVLAEAVKQLQVFELPVLVTH